MSSIVPPAASTAAFTFSHTCRVCSVMSPMPAMLPSGRRAVMPEMKTNRPVASIAVAWEKTPFGWRSLGLLICTLGMTLFLRRVLERMGDAELAGEAHERRSDGRIDLDLSVRASPPLPFRLAWREQPVDAGRALTGANALLRHGDLLTKQCGFAEMRHVDRDEEMRAVVGHAEVAVERTHLCAGGALRQEPA